MEWDGSRGDLDLGISAFERLSSASLYIQKNKAVSVELQKAKDTFQGLIDEYRACRNEGDLDSILEMESGVQQFDALLAQDGQSKKFFENQHNEIYKIAKIWEEMQDPKKVQEIYGKIAAQTGQVTGDVTVKRYVNAEIRGLRRLSGNALLPEGYRELTEERIECWRAFQHEHGRHIKRALEGLIEEG